MKKFILFFLLFPIYLFANINLIQSGPMLGYSDMREVLLWIQTKQSCKVQFKYYDIDNPKDVFLTDTFRTKSDNFFIAKLIANKVLPGKKYKYDVLINDKVVKLNYPTEFKTPVNWRWKTEPPEFKFAFGSCLYINDEMWDRKGKPYGGEYFILNSIYEKKPDFMIWLGDNIYLREGDWNTKTGIYYRWTHTRSIPEFQPLLANVHQYGIWDDHEFGPNDSDRGFWNKNTALQAFKDFMGNTEYVFENEGITSKFEWGDCDFFLLDNRWWKAPNGLKDSTKPYFGEKQLQWLIDNLIYSNAKFKFICGGGQILNPLQVFENYSNYSVERQKLLDAISKYKIKGVVFITGDRHFSELSKLTLNDGTIVYDYTSSTLSAGENKKGCSENNPLRIDGTCYDSRNFGLIEVSGDSKNRKLNLILFDNKGNKIWNYEIKETDF